ncbi:hypothetical protein R3P38DRAFT_3285397 [Favolaschia claudopus]|uniref:F-box domain-containing protein n=1 Tax=Favolaschia claudopus TaxID=2862362 RepID=A0AAW0A4A4_9AGAR
MDHRPQHPLYIFELLGHCLDFLDPASGDLCSCALVARLWVYPAQARLFRVPFTTNKLFSFRDSTALRFHDSLLNSPHLLPLVRELTFKWMNYLTPGVFTQICRLNFTNLESLTIELRRSEDTLWQAIWDLLSARTLRSFALDLCHVGVLYPFRFPVSMWLLDNSSQGIEHFDLICADWSLEGYDPPSARALADPIYLTSIRLVLQWDRPQLDEFTLPMFYPFDLSKLRAISVIGKGSFPWNSLPKGSIELLAFTPGQHEEEIFDLSLLPKLSVLRVSTSFEIGAVPLDLSRLLTTIKLGHRIETIVIYLDPYIIQWAELDLALSSLPHPLPVIEFDFHHPASRSETLRMHFPVILSRMSSKVTFFLSWIALEVI